MSDKSETIKCRCGKILGEKEGGLVVIAHIAPVLIAPVDPMTEGISEDEIRLCEECFDALRRWMDVHRLS